MILKQKQFTPQTDPRLIAGDAAEKQMAFYLQRMFGQAQDIIVINDLRIEHAGEVAQIDHLIVSRWGLCIVESKSVTDSVHINAHGEWARECKGKKQGMPSPLRQGEAQGFLLKQLLADNAHVLLGTLLGLQKRFGYCPIQIYVAISDSGMIQREMALPEVMKADTIAPAIENWLKERSSFKAILTSTDWAMGTGEAKMVANFLVSRHAPLGVQRVSSVNQIKAESQPHKPAAIAVDQLCPECGSHKLLRKSLTRAGSQPREFLACAAYPKACRGIFPLPRAAGDAIKTVVTLASAVTNTAVYLAGDACPKCSDGMLVKRKGKSEFLGCSNYRSKRCTFTDYRDDKLSA
ncbi:nuclease-related domain-containing protein [Sulfuriferula sp.]|uniref:nuclease-related domain-containing protein n=1 Tax=Sulfuriferula sp. TaxID=2025307 RepID=UPI002730C984|nr:NERD domain-containing protein [Sulfuriferula sp.]MDP2027854.1 NERD domain-containing protein [Sulfuriferula sp.]